MPTITIQPNGTNGKDVSYRINDNSNSNGGILLIGRAADGFAYRSAIQFDLTGIPSSAVITSAVMNLKMSSQVDPTSFLILVHEIQSLWTESTATGINQPSFNTTQSTSSYSSAEGVSFNVTSLVSAWVSGIKKNNGVLLKHSDSTETVYLTLKQFYSSNESVVENRPTLTVTYNESPYAPTLTSPNGGESLNESHEITWSASTDPENDGLTYQIDLSTNNGSTWKNIANNVSGISRNYNFVNEPETSQALIRIRSYDGHSYSPYDYSNGIFTIQHNFAPTTPQNLSPSGIVIDHTKVSRFSWKHNDSANDNQSKADLRWRIVGSSTWNDITTNGMAQEYYFSANALPTGQIEWQVRTYDSAALVSPWSNVAVFSSAEPTNVPIITSPTSTVTVARPVIQWTSVSQSSYQIVIENSLGEVVWDTGEVVSTVKARTSGIDLLNGGIYKIKVRVKDGSGLFSSFNEITVTVAYTPPASPILDLFKSDASIQLVITNPTPTGTQPNVTGNDIFKIIDGEWVRIASNVNATFTDYAVADNMEYTYFVVALGETGVYSYSTEVTQSVTFRGSYIHDPLDAEFTIFRFNYNGTGAESEFTPETALMKFVGRKRPVVQYGNYADFSVNVTLQASRDMTPMLKLREFVANQTPICYRDDNGHFLYGVIQTLPITQEYSVATADVTITEIDYDVEV